MQPRATSVVAWGNLDAAGEGSVPYGPAASTRFGIALPVHNEEELLPAALASLDRAIDYASGILTAPIRVVVVLDDCTDRSSQIADEWRRGTVGPDGTERVQILATKFRSVGGARSAGCGALLEQWSDFPPEDIWLATTDADSEVPRDWITAQLEARGHGTQLWIGSVQVRDWRGRTAETADAWQRQYEAEHLPVHGANFGIDARTYLGAGGFQGLVTSEDRALFERAVGRGAVVRGDSTVRVTTSGRREARAPLGFAHALSSIEATLDAEPRDARVCLR